MSRERELRDRYGSLVDHAPMMRRDDHKIPVQVDDLCYLLDCTADGDEVRELTRICDGIVTILRDHIKTGIQDPDLLRIVGLRSAATETLVAVLSKEHEMRLMFERHCRDRIREAHEELESVKAELAALKKEIA